MKPGRSSVTAQATTLVRALESHRPEPEKLLDDPLAREFLHGSNRLLLRLLCAKGIGRTATCLLDRLLAGTRDSVVARTLHIDAALRDALAGGVRQVVILGAGFDSRALRIDGIERARVFEVDHPDTQSRKRSCLKKMLPSEPAHLTFVAIDFDRAGESLGEALFNAGFRDDLCTFFVWEGVTEYLSAEAVDRTLRFIAGSAPGSTVALSYKDASLLRDPTAKASSRSAMLWARWVGEPWTFGIDPAVIAPFLAARRLVLIEDADSSVREARHLPPGRRPTASGRDHTALAEVATLGPPVRKSVRNTCGKGQVMAKRSATREEAQSRIAIPTPTTQPATFFGRVSFSDAAPSQGLARRIP